MTIFNAYYRGSMEPQGASGFTLIELSIVLVVIGLIVGGVLVGQDLVRAAEVRATISQVERYNMAVNTFRLKYDALPGDMNAQTALAFGFTPRGQYAGEGDGNGLIEGVGGNSPAANYGWVEGAGETVMFWVDLSTANGLDVNLIEGGFSLASPTTPPGSSISGTALAGYFPSAKLGRGNYFYVYSNINGINYFGLSAPTLLSAAATCYWCMASTANLTVLQAYSIDKKLDDGLPASGNVTARYADYVSFSGSGVGNAPNAATSSPTTCYDTTSNTYSIKRNSGNGVNCALSFQFQ